MLDIGRDPHLDLFVLTKIHMSLTIPNLSSQSLYTAGNHLQLLVLVPST